MISRVSCDIGVLTKRGLGLDDHRQRSVAVVGREHQLRFSSYVPDHHRRVRGPERVDLKWRGPNLPPKYIGEPGVERVLGRGVPENRTRAPCAHPR